MKYPIDPETGLPYEPEPGERTSVVHRNLRKEQIHEMYTAGNSAKIIAMLLNISVRTVQRALEKEPVHG